MEATDTFTSERPYLLVVIDDVDAPDWNALSGEIRRQAQLGSARVALMIRRESGLARNDPDVLALVESLQRSGIDAVIVG
jgi:hypothetical protein